MVQNQFGQFTIPVQIRRLVVAAIRASTINLTDVFGRMRPGEDRNGNVQIRRVAFQFNQRQSSVDGHFVIEDEQVGTVGGSFRASQEGNYVAGVRDHTDGAATLEALAGTKALGQDVRFRGVVVDDQNLVLWLAVHII